MSSLRRADGSLPGAVVGLLAGSVLAVAGCAPGVEEPAWEAGECSGAPCVISHRAQWAEGESWRVDPEPRLWIPPVGDDGDLLFSDVVAVRSLADGTLGVADWRSSQIVVFDADGQLLRLAGGRGEGPNEFRRILWFSSCAPGQFHVLDLGRRLATLEPGGTVVASVDLGERLQQAAQRRVCSDDGVLAGMGGTGGPLMSTEPALIRGQGVVKLSVPDAEVLTLGAYPISELLIGVGDGRPHLLGRHTSLALGGGLVYVGTADRFEIDVYSLDGALVRRQTRPFDDLALTSAHLDALIELELPLLSEREQELHLMHLRAGNNPESLPAYDALLVDPEGALWAHHFRRPGTSANTWSVFDRDGVWLGEVEMPARFEAHEIGIDRVLGTQRDELDEVSVASYGLDRSL